VIAYHLRCAFPPPQRRSRPWFRRCYCRCHSDVSLSETVFHPLAIWLVWRTHRPTRARAAALGIVAAAFCSGTTMGIQPGSRSFARLSRLTRETCVCQDRERRMPRGPAVLAVVTVQRNEGLEYIRLRAQLYEAWSASPLHSVARHHQSDSRVRPRSTQPAVVALVELTCRNRNSRGCKRTATAARPARQSRPILEVERFDPNLTGLDKSFAAEQDSNSTRFAACARSSRRLRTRNCG
jgi:hypothetical protein